MARNLPAFVSVLLISLITLVFLPACGDDGDQPAEEDAQSSTDEGAKTPDAGLEPPKNYIPLNDEACVIETKSPALIDAAHALLTKVSTDFTTLVGEGLEICGPGMKNGCPACAPGENPMGDLTAELSERAFAFFATMGIELGSITSISEYFRVALLYPYRYILVSWSEGEDGTYVILSQGKRHGCAGGDRSCAHFSMESESLDLSCEQFSLQLEGPAAKGEDGATVIEAALAEQWADKVTFGYVVPLTENLPENPESISETEIDLWLDHIASIQERLDVRLRQPRVRITVNPDGSGCGTISGRVDKQIFYTYAESEGLPIQLVEDIINKHLAKDDPEMIESVTSFRLEAATVLSGIPCNRKACDDAPADTCDGDILKAKSPNADCRLPRPETYTSGDPIDPACDYREPHSYEVDCAAVGGACEKGSCTVDWKPPRKGDVVISEVMVRPETDRGSSCWFELTNVSDHAVDIAGCLFNGSDKSVMEVWRMSPYAPAVIPPGGAFVIGSIPDIAENGGLSPDAVHNFYISIVGYDEGTSDYLSMTCHNELIDEVSWGREQNKLEFGASLQLDPGAYDHEKNDEASNWCNDSTSRYGDGGNGTPGEKNPDCP
jgi:hypothetical protein